MNNYLRFFLRFNRWARYGIKLQKVGKSIMLFGRKPSKEQQRLDFDERTYLKEKAIRLANYYLQTKDENKKASYMNEITECMRLANVEKILIRSDKELVLGRLGAEFKPPQNYF